MNDVHAFLNSLPPKPRKVKKKVVITNMEWLKKCYYAAREKGFANKYPTADKEGHYFKKDFPDVRETNGTTRYIVECLNNLGHFAERINTTGIMRGEKYTYAANTKGSTDIHVTLSGGKSWKIEIKKSKDGLSTAQERYQEKVIAVGGLHSVVYVGDLQYFWNEYKRVLKL